MPFSVIAPFRHSLHRFHISGQAHPSYESTRSTADGHTDSEARAPTFLGSHTTEEFRRSAGLDRTATSLSGNAFDYTRQK